MKNIILVDDESSTHTAMGLIVMNLGYRLTSIFCCETALSLVKNPKFLGKPFMIFVDYMLGHISGVDIIRQMRKTDYFKKIPIFLYTGCDEAELEDVAKELNVAAVIRKPFSREDFLNCVEGKFNKKQQPLINSIL